jgi:hypothetical protein
MMRRLALVAALLALGTVGAAAADCMVAMEEASAEGRLVRGRFEDAAGRPEITIILELKRPGCLTGTDDYDRIDSTPKIHVYSTDAKIRRALSQAVGKIVRVTGKPFGEHTAHHHAPIVMDVARVEPIMPARDRR